MGSYSKFWGPTALYRLFAADGELLYVGISHSPEKRCAQHAATQGWWHLVASKTTAWFEERVTDADAEVEAIRSEKPRFNSAHATVSKPRPTPARGVTVTRMSSKALQVNFGRLATLAHNARYELGELPIAYVEKRGETTAAIVPAWLAEWVEANASAVLELIETGAAPKPES